jgi:hypothetical protein
MSLILTALRVILHMTHVDTHTAHAIEHTGPIAHIRI